MCSGERVGVSVAFEAVQRQKGHDTQIFLPQGRGCPSPIIQSDEEPLSYEQVQPLGTGAEDDGAGLERLDPVCLMDVDPATARWKAEYKGRTYYFCAPGCKKAFEREPHAYA